MNTPNLIQRRQQAVQETLALAAAMEEKQRRQSLEDTDRAEREADRIRHQQFENDDRAFQGEVRDRTKKGWATEDRLRPLIEPTAATEALRPLLQGTDYTQYPEYVKRVAAAGIDVSALPQGFASQKAFMDWLNPAEAMRHRNTMEEIGARGEYGAGTRPIMQKIRDASGNLVYGQLDSKTGRWVPIEGGFAPTTGRDYSTLTPKERTDLWVKFGSQYDKSFTDVDGTLRQGAPPRTQWIQEQIRTSLDQEESADEKGDTVEFNENSIAAITEPTRFQKRFIPYWRSLSEDGRDALYSEILSSDAPNSKQLLDLIDKYEKDVKTGQRQLGRKKRLLDREKKMSTTGTGVVSTMAER